MEDVTLTSFEAENIYSWKRVKLDFTSSVQALIGRNDTGKSNLLKAVGLLGELVRGGGLPAAFGERAEFERVRLWGSADDVKVSVTGEVLGLRAAYSVSFRRRKVLSEQLVFGDDWSVVRHEAGMMLTKKGRATALELPDSHRLLWSVVDRGELAVAEVSEFQAALSGLQVRRLRADAIARPCAAGPSLILGEDGSGLAAVLERLAGHPLKHGVFDSVNRRLKQLVQSIERVGVDADATDPNLRVLKFVAPFGSGSRAFPAADASEGILVALAILVLVESGGEVPVLLLEELENGLHPKRLGEVVSLLRELAAEDDLHVLLTTHSPYLLDALRPDEVSIVTRDAQGHSHLQSMADFPELDAWRKGFSTGEIWSNLDEARLTQRESA